jgi:predicted RNase H-like nuclease (RuvC/YqgF family)
LNELEKYEALLNDFKTVETQVVQLKKRYELCTRQNAELEIKISELKEENTELTKKIDKLETDLNKMQKEGETNLFNSLNVKERESLKDKLQDLISKIDYHISS